MNCKKIFMNLSIGLLLGSPLGLVLNAQSISNNSVPITPIIPSSISDNDLRKLFLISDIWPNQLAGKDYGGIVLFKNYFDKNKNACELKKSHPDMTVLVDQEGGSVVRIKDAAPPSPTQAKKMTQDQFYSAVKESAKKLKADCIDVNLAPVIELSEESDKKDTRSYGESLDEVVPRATTFSKSMQSEGIKTVLKHFPGWNDHCVPLTELNALNLKVKKGSEALKCKMMARFDKIIENLMVFNRVPSNAWMVGNHIYEELGPYPSSMNPAVHDLIRDKMHYKGLLMSDALWEIEAGPKAIIMALKVNDWVMVGKPEQVEVALPYIQSAIRNGIFTEAEIREKLQRINEFNRKKL